uniref:HERV-H LTR-associating 2a, tandem duplicate 2 n=1 Tax=Nothobranchius furzeri TaxID=105023 RepID=A0A8C6PXI8_NOTFU
MTWSSSKGNSPLLLNKAALLSLTTFSVVLPDVNVTCIVHDDCILPCSFRPTGTVVIHWYKQQIPVHSYYYHKDQFGLQNKHFSGRTSLFNSHIPQGNASLLLRRVKIQDRGRYKCYTSTRKGNQEMFVNMELKEFHLCLLAFFIVSLLSLIVIIFRPLLSPLKPAGLRSLKDLRVAVVNFYLKADLANNNLHFEDHFLPGCCKCL